MGFINGTNVVVQLEGKPIGHSTSCSMTFNTDLPEATNKDSAGWREVIAGVRDAEVSFDGMVDPTDDGVTKQGVKYLTAAYTGRTQLTVIFGTGTTGEEIYTFEAFLSNLELTADAEQPATYSGTLTSTGAIVPSDNA